jgi:ribosomal protein L11 methylase PrmA
MLFSEIFDKFDPGVVLDLGSNDGHFSRLISKKTKKVISLDTDPACVEKNYLENIKNNETNIVPLLIDLTNPSPGIGWQNEERPSFFERVKVDTIVALALIHHLAISQNIPLDNLAAFFHKKCHFLIIEFVPKSDSQVKRLLSVRDDIFPDYTRQVFESAFMKHFVVLDTMKIDDSERILYFMECNED